ncbi:MAG: hypothetical protein RLY16_468, partial [Bacteroidota bacterium]
MQTVIGNSIDVARDWLIQNELVAIPTETVYGLAGNALNEKAVAGIFAAKNRPHFNPLILHVADWSQVEKYVANIPPEAHLLAAAFCPGPITFLLPKKSTVPDLVTAGSDRVAIRIPNHALTLALLAQLDFPLAAPSANPFGYVSPTTAQHVFDGLQGKIPYILDGGPSGVGVESTIVGFEPDGAVLVYRYGGISQEAIEAVLQHPVKRALGESATHADTPGRLKSHYAPHTALYRGNMDELLLKWKGKNVAVISFSKFYEGVKPEWSFV